MLSTSAAVAVTQYSMSKMSVLKIQSGPAPHTIKKILTMHKKDDGLPVWLIWKHNGWLVQTAIRSTPRETRADGVLDGHLRLFVRAPPIKGKANQTIIAAIA